MCWSKWTAAVSAAVLAVAGRVGDVAEIARGVAGDYEVTEREFAQKLIDMDSAQ